jgi:hypothetical protein
VKSHKSHFLFSLTFIQMVPEKHPQVGVHLVFQ